MVLLGEALRTSEPQPPASVMREGGVSYKPDGLVLTVKENLSHESPGSQMGSIAEWLKHALGHQPVV